MSDRTARWGLLVVVFMSSLLAWGTGSSGIWDPSELEVAEAARASLAVGDTSASLPTLHLWLIRHSFSAFGEHAWAGRMSGVVAGGIACLLLFFWVRRDVGKRAGTAAVIILVSSPIFLLSARLMMGAAVGITSQLLVGFAVFRFCTSGLDRPRQMRLVALLAGAIALSTWASGVLLGPLPPLIAVVIWCGLVGETLEGRVSAAPRWLLTVLSLGLVVGVVRAIFRDATSFDWWIGGGVVGGDPPTYDAALEVVFHGFAPWSAALPIAALAMLTPRARRSPRAQDLAWFWMLWSGFAFVTWTVFASRYGHPPYLAVAPLSGLVALWLTEIVDARRPSWGAAVVVVLSFGLLIRDFALYPQSALRGLPTPVDAPTVVRMSAGWAITFSVAMVAFVLVLVAPAGRRPPGIRRATAWLKDQWQAGGGRRAWLVVTGSLSLGMVAFGAACFVFDLPVSSLLTRIGRVLLLLPFAVAAILFTGPWLVHVTRQLGEARRWLVLASGLGLVFFMTGWFEPAMSQQLSSKAVYDAYEALAGDDEEPLVSYRMPADTARYYNATPATEIERRDTFVEYMQTGGQRWALVPAEELPLLDREFRDETGRHLFVADATNARVLLVAAQEVEGRDNESFLATHVVDQRPAVDHEVDADLAEKLLLVGYSLSLPEGSSVGAGQRFSITWVWEAIGKPPSGYEVFVHIDGNGRRLNGDHAPVDSRYPFKFWREGDIVIDTQTLRVPASFPRGDYTIYVGVFKGDKRLEVTRGDQDGANRLNVGVLRVR